MDRQSSSDRSSASFIMQIKYFIIFTLDANQTPAILSKQVNDLLGNDIKTEMMI